MAEAIEITPEMRAQIGVEADPWPYEVTTAGVRAFARGVGYRDPIYYDAGAARGAGYPALPAPPCYLGTPVFLPGQSDPVFSTPPGTGPRPRYGLTEVLDARTEVVYERPLLAGETLMGRHRLVDLQVKRSRSLGAMLLVSTETTFRDGSGKLAACERSQYIFY
jgi:N-terminal half of MaoC dehydratase